MSFDTFSLSVWVPTSITEVSEQAVLISISVDVVPSCVSISVEAGRNSIGMALSCASVSVPISDELYGNFCTGFICGHIRRG